MADIIQTQRRASLAQLQELNRAKYAGANPDGPEELAWSLVVDSMIFAAEAEVRWLDHSEQRLALHPASRHGPGAVDRQAQARTPRQGARGRRASEARRDADGHGRGAMTALRPVDEPVDAQIRCCA